MDVVSAEEFIAEAGRAFRADRGDAGQRLDRSLMRHLADQRPLSRTRVQAWIEAGRVGVNGAPACKAAQRLALGDTVEVRLPQAPARLAPAAQEMPLTILYEDEHLLAVAKPPGLVVHPAFGHRDGTLLNALLWHLRAQPGSAPRLGLVNRLDRGTSGVVLAAKTAAAHAGIARASRARAVVKEYLAVVRGGPPRPAGRIRFEIGRDPDDRRRMALAAAPGAGREAVTLYEQLATAGAGRGRLTLLRCRLLTGRTHQIRLHLQAAGMPLVGDPVYGGGRRRGIAAPTSLHGRGDGLTDPAVAALCGEFPRQALHAARLALPHPVTRALLDLVAPLPSDLAGLLAAAGLAAESLR